MTNFFSFEQNLRSLFLLLFVLHGMQTIGAQDRVPSFDEKLHEQWTAKVQPLLAKYCSECHGKETSEADVDISKFADLTAVRKQPALWDQIRGVARIGAMPPPDAPQPTLEEKETLSQWVENALHRVDCQVPQPPGHVTLRRLNNTEYDNTIRQLFGIDLVPSQKIGFVSDEVGNGFDNQGEVLSLPPLLLEKYFQAGELVAETAIVSDRESLRRQTKEGEALFEGERYSTEFEFSDGDYEINLRMRNGDNQKENVKAKVFVDDLEVQEFDVEPKSKSFDFRHKFIAGRHRIEVFFSDDLKETEAPKLENRLYVERFRIEGPSEGMPAYPESHLQIMKMVPSDSISVAEAARVNFRSLLRLAYRRPPEEIEIERIVSIVERASGGGMSFSDSMKIGVQAMLVSPQFLFRMERTEGEEVRPGVRRVQAFDLASRLSYFLWSRPPDEELLREAEDGGLADPKRLNQQIDRMLDDPRSTAMVQGFFAQWLGLRNIATIEVDSNRFPQWSDRLRASMVKETELFCSHLLSREGKLVDVLNGDFTFINPRLAELYGLEFEGRDPYSMYIGNPGRPNKSGDLRRSGVYFQEDRYVRVQVPPNRRGMLTQASVLTLTSNPSRTSPVKRGKWVLENILGDPPPPAPPNVPAFEETQKEHQNISLRKQLEIHRSNPSCASCHKVLDPIGLGLENFNAIGVFRETDNANKIEADGEFVDGRKFSGAIELLEALKSDQPKISRHFARMLLTYALGRGLATADECAVDEIIRHAAADDDRVRSFIRAVIASQPFQFHSSDE